MSWIKLVIHPEHEKVLRIADLTGSSPDAAFVGSVRWFRWVDAHVESADTGISTLSFRVVTRWADDGLSRAMLHDDVDWLEKDHAGLLHPSRYGTHFSKSAKQRALNNKRVERHRNASANGPPLQERVPDLDSESEQDKGEMARVRARAEADRPTDSDGMDRVLAALDGWCKASNGREIIAARGEHEPVRIACAAWEQARCFDPPGTPVAWADAVARCVRAAVGNGTKFGRSPRYAVTVIGGMLSEWETKGIVPDAPREGPKFVPADDGAADRGFEDAMRRIEAKKARSA